MLSSTTFLEDYPTHPGLLRVVRQPGEYNSYLVIQKSLQKGEVITAVEGVTKGPKAYSSLQCGTDDNSHIELNSDLLYINHSCEPNVHFDVSSTDMKDLKLVAERNIDQGETLCFFYPSTEWKMAAPFECKCGTKTCLGSIQGANFLTREELLKRGFINRHILELLEQRDAEESS